MTIYNKSARVKLKLLLNGVRIDKSALNGLGTDFKEYQYGYNDSNWDSHKTGRLIPSELVLPGKLVVASHLRPSSPYLIKKLNDHLYIINEREDEVLTDVDYLPRPQIWDIRLSDGSNIKKYLNVYGANCLNLFVVANCEFWSEGNPCAFCSLQPTQNQHQEVVVNKSLPMIEEAIEKAFAADKSIGWMIITGGSLTNRNLEIERYIQVLSTIQKHIPTSWNGKIKGNAALLPTNSEFDLERLHSTGIEHPSFNLEVWGASRFASLCPGKAKHAPLYKLIETYKKAVSIWGEGEVWCNFVGGITPIQDLKNGFRAMADLGVVPGANIFHLDPKAPAVKMGLNEPTEEYVLEMYDCLAAIYKEYGYKPFFSHSVLRNSLSNEKYNGWL